MSRRTRGYTLTEIIVSIAVVAALAGAVAPLVMRQLDRSRVSRADSGLERIGLAFTSYADDTGMWPCLWDPASSHDFDGRLVAFSCLYSDNGLDGWSGPYLDTGVEIEAQRLAMAREIDGSWSGDVDPWGRPYGALFLGANGKGAEGARIVLFSLGENGEREASRETLARGQTEGDDRVYLMTLPSSPE